jgi:hypothetical protein
MILFNREGLMGFTSRFVLALLLLGGVALYAQREAGPIQTTTAPMSEPVIRQRLQKMGYSNIQIIKTNTLRYEVRAVKQGEPVVLQFHPQTGHINEITPGKNVAKPWTMPLEHPGNIRLEPHPSHELQQKKEEVPRTMPPPK